MAKHYYGEVGTTLLVDCGTDISAATTHVLYCSKPDGTRVEWAATVYGTNYLQYTTVSGDLNVIGKYYVQAGITLGGWTGRGDTDSFIIVPYFM